MRISHVVAACGLGLGLATGSWALGAAGEPPSAPGKWGPAARAALRARPDRLLVRLAPGASGAALPAGSSAAGRGWWRVPVAATADWRSVAEELTRSPDVARVELDALHELGPLPTERAAESGAIDAGYPNDPLFPQQWHHLAIGAQAAWEASRGAGVLVAIIDSGISQGGKDLACAPLAGEYDAVADVDGPGAAADVLGHGTFVAGVVAQCTDNAEGVAGLAHDARLLAIKACTPDAECAASDVARAIDWATSHGARVVNLSLGMACPDADWPECSTEIENDAIARAVAAGVTLVAIAGNGDQDRIGFPANHPDVIGVGGVETRLLKTTYSSYGSALSVMAPAGEPDIDRDGDGFEDQILQETRGRICKPYVAWAYCRWSGTSFAAPHVVATLALLLSRHPGATRSQLRRAIEESALDRGAPGFDPIYGHGVVQADAAVARLDTIVAADPPLCVPSTARLCLGERFALESTWEDYLGGTGSGATVPLGDSGLFWFFAPTNLELLVKVLDGCGVNGHHWLFAAGTTDVRWSLTVTDLATGAVRSYENPLGLPSPAVTDTEAFACP